MWNIHNCTQTLPKRTLFNEQLYPSLQEVQKIYSIDAYNPMGIFDQCKTVPEDLSRASIWKSKHPQTWLHTPQTLIHALPKVHWAMHFVLDSGPIKTLLSSAFKTKRIYVYVCFNVINYNSRQSNRPKDIYNVYERRSSVRIISTNETEKDNQRIRRRQTM